MDLLDKIEPLGFNILDGELIEPLGLNPPVLFKLLLPAELIDALGLSFMLVGEVKDARGLLISRPFEKDPLGLSILWVGELVGFKEVLGLTLTSLIIEFEITKESLGLISGELYEAIDGLCFNNSFDTISEFSFLIEKLFLLLKD